MEILYASTESRGALKKRRNLDLSVIRDPRHRKQQCIEFTFLFMSATKDIAKRGASIKSIS